MHIPTSIPYYANYCFTTLRTRLCVSRNVSAEPADNRYAMKGHSKTRNQLEFYSCISKQSFLFLRIVQVKLPIKIRETIFEHN